MQRHLEQRARVVRVSGDHAWVRAARGSGCRVCASGRGCGVGLFGRLAGDRCPTIKVRNTIGAGVGAAVVVAVDAAAAARGGWWAYGVPLGAFLAGLLVSQAPAWPAPIAADLAGAAGAALGLALAYGMQRAGLGGSAAVAGLTPTIVRYDTVVEFSNSEGEQYV